MSTIPVEIAIEPEASIGLPGSLPALQSRIHRRTARVGVIGLGYVGLPLAVELGKAGFSVTGIDIAEHKISRINKGESYIQDVPSDDIASLLDAGKLRATTDFSVIRDLDTINIA